MNEYDLEWPNYSPFPYERFLAQSELVALTGGVAEFSSERLRLRTTAPVNSAAVERLAFAAKLRSGVEVFETSISRLERSSLSARFGSSNSARKESNYLTHGLHRYKGKFYPQMARALLNISGAKEKDLVLDPFMGSGTTLVESWLLGIDSLGFDINPLAHLVTKTKVGALRAGATSLRRNIDYFESSLRTIAQQFGMRWSGRGENDPTPARRLSAFDLAKAIGSPEAEKELASWFPASVLEKLVVVLRAVDTVKDATSVDFIRVCLSDILRGVSQQEPRDLRIRRRSEQIEGAEVFSALFAKIELELKKIEAGSHLLPIAPPDFWPEWGDIRHSDPRQYAGPAKRLADAVVSSPPYATALPYVDTDRLSLLILGLTNPKRRNRLQKELIGTREIGEGQRKELEQEMLKEGGLTSFPKETAADLRHILGANSRAGLGFRRRNTGALLYQYFRDMRQAMRAVANACRHGAPVFLVLGDSRTTLGTGEVFTIRTCDHIAALCSQVGLREERRLRISVTTEDLAHNKNAITENQILALRRH